MYYCIYCGSNEFYTVKKGVHVGEYCKKCNKWRKWLKQCANPD